MKAVQQRDRRASTGVRVPKIARLGGAHQLQHGQEDLWKGVGGLNLICRAAAGAGGADGDDADAWTEKTTSVNSVEQDDAFMLPLAVVAAAVHIIKHAEAEFPAAHYRDEHASATSVTIRTLVRC